MIRLGMHYSSRLSIRPLLSTVVCAVMFSFVASSRAERQPQPLAKGFSAEMVRKTWGPPIDVQEREISRLVVWSYQNGGTVTLGEGKVVDFQMPKGYVPPVEPAQAELEPAQTESVDASLTRDLVREIAREIPSSPDSPLSGISDSPTEPTPVVQQPMPAYPAQGGFQGVPNQQRGSFYVPEESDE